MSQDKNFKAYRNALNESTKSCVPWLRVHLHDVKVIYESHRRVSNQDGYDDVINFELYHRVHERIRHILGYQDTPYEFEDSTRRPDIEAFVDGQLRSLVVDDTLRDWLQKRATKLAREEHADFASHQQELVATGFIRPR